MKKELTEYQLERYSRQIILSDIGGAGQSSILNSSILVIGVGGLGSTAVNYLAMAGVGKIGIVDFDKISLSNLNRQLLFKESDVDKFKVDIIKSRIKEMNSDIEVIIFNEKFSINNSKKILRNFDLILDCTDNFDSRYLINDECFKYKKKLISTSLHNFEIHLLAFEPWLKFNPCYRCIFPQKKNNIGNCSDLGIISTVAGMGGILQANHSLKVILNLDKDMFKKLIIYDCQSNNQTTINLKKDLSCKLCSSFN